MKKLLKHLWLASSLIFFVISLLLFSDFDRRVGSANSDNKLPSIAVLQFLSTPLLDKHVNGIVDELEQSGYLEDDKSNLTIFNPQGDYGVANSIANEMVHGDFDYLITSSTVALQIIAKANQNIKKTHVFGAVTDPYGAGVGISGTNENEHPPYLTGIGSFQPVEKAFIIAKKMNPSLQRVGVVWNAAEQCSEACTFKAREICEQIDIELVEVNINSTNEISEAVSSLLAKKVEAIWIGGDSFVNSASPIIIKRAFEQKVPVFSNDPTDVENNALFGLGANYYKVGQYTGKMVVELINGKSPADYKIENVLPEKLVVNRELINNLKMWELPDEILSQVADDENLKNGVKDIKLNLTNPAKIAIVNLTNSASLEEAELGLKEGLEEYGLIQGKNLVINYYNAQGDMSLLSQIFDSAIQIEPDALVSITSPALIIGASKRQNIPYIFCVASDPFKLGLFKNGRPNYITGVYEESTTAKLVDLAIEHNPKLKSVGIIYDPSQPQSLLEVEELRKAGKIKKIEVLEVSASSVSELSVVTKSLVQRNADAFILSADNLINTGYPIIQKIADQSDIPIFVTDLQKVEMGAAGGIGINYREWGKQASTQVAKVLAGISPADISLEPANTSKVLNPKFFRKIKKSQSRYKLRLVLYNETKFAEDCVAGLLKGLEDGGLVEGSNFDIRTLNAQGDISTLSSIMTSVKSDEVDLLMVVSTPCLQAALRQVKDTKIIFTGVGDAVKAGAGKSETDHLPNVTGITVRSPFAGMARLINETLPNVKQVGTLYTPSEINSELYRGWFEEELAKYDIQLKSVPVTASSETAQATRTLCSENIQAVAQIVDNTTRPGFSQIARKAADNNLPVFVFDSSQMQEGGTVCLARDYFDASVEAAEKAIRVLEGETPNNIPFNNTTSEKLILNMELAQKYKLLISHKLRNDAEKFFINNK